MTNRDTQSMTSQEELDAVRQALTAYFSDTGRSSFAWDKAMDALILAAKKVERERLQSWIAAGYTILPDGNILVEREAKSNDG